MQNHNQQNIEIFNKNRKIHIQIFYYLAIDRVYGKYDTTMSFDAIQTKGMNNQRRYLTL